MVVTLPADLDGYRPPASFLTIASVSLGAGPWQLSLEMPCAQQKAADALKCMQELTKTERACGFKRHWKGGRTALCPAGWSAHRSTLLCCSGAGDDAAPNVVVP